MPFGTSPKVPKGIRTMAVRYSNEGVNLMKKTDINFFPGWVRKSISFTIDDGNLTMDKKFIDIVKKGGIKGTFNIGNFHFDQLSAEGYREFYKGYEIANHVRLHPLAFKSGVTYTVKDTPRPETAEESNDIYPQNGHEGLYSIVGSRGWRRIAADDTYIRLTAECSEQIKEVFFDQPALAFVWPYSMQDNPAVFARLKTMGFYALRKTGALSDSTNFDLPADRTAWSYNAGNRSLLTDAKLFRDYPDDGRLKTFIFGVHSADFEKSGNWCDLEEFTEQYGGRPQEFWYATNYEIFHYEDAVKSLQISDNEIDNPSDVAVYIKIDGSPAVIEPHAKLPLA